MVSRAQYAVQHLAAQPPGWKVRSKRAGTHVLRIAFPPGPRRRGAGKVLEVLHPKGNPQCPKACTLAKKNPAELLVFGNPHRARKAVMPRGGGIVNHKPGCECPFCKRARGQTVSRSRSPRENPVRVRVVQDSLTKKWTAVYHDSQFGDTYAAADTKQAAVKALRDRIRKMRGAVARASSNPRRRHGARPTGHRSRRRANPSGQSQAVMLFEKFHGRDAKEIIEEHRSAAMRLDYTSLGPLVALGFDDGGFSEKKLPNHWDECPNVGFEGDGVKLASAPNGKQLYLIGGNQNLDAAMRDFEGIDPSKDFVDFGEIFFVVYDARKAHDNFEPAEYTHKFGKNRPRLVYDKLKKEAVLVGGEYFIDLRPAVAPGIEG